MEVLAYRYPYTQTFSRIKIAAKSVGIATADPALNFSSMFDLNFTASGDHMITVGG
jgi:hypothetical protein